MVLDMFNQDLTIVNKWYNKTTKLNEYRVHSLKGFFSSYNGIGLSGTDLIKQDGFVAYILMSEEGYQTPKDFQTNPIGWTLQNDDYIVKGIVSSVTKIEDIQESYECMKITNVAVKDYGSSDMQHYAIKGE